MYLKMNKLLILLLLLFSINFENIAQINLHTEDLPRFYQAFDSVMTTSDSLKKIYFIKTLYEDKASAGLKKFMEIRWANTSEWYNLMKNEKAKMIEKRPYILSVLKQEPIIKAKIERFKKLYPKFRDGDIYFCVGKNNSGGTIYNNTVYIGAEVAAYDKPDWAVSLVLHEFTHTQQWIQRNIIALEADTTFANNYEKTHANLLGKCIEEGMADFVAGLVNDSASPHPQAKNEKQIWEMFKTQMNKPFNNDDGWLYAQKELNGEKISDLGYFMGNMICKSYYQKAKNKKKALDFMLNLNLTDENSEKFLAKSGYK
jgi:hypothetical protein